MALGVLGLGLGSCSFICFHAGKRKRKFPTHGIPDDSFAYFNLNKWEMLTNRTGVGLFRRCVRFYLPLCNSLIGPLEQGTATGGLVNLFLMALPPFLTLFFPALTAEAVRLCWTSGVSR